MRRGVAFDYLPAGNELKVVAAPRNIAKAIVNNDWHDVYVFMDDRCRVDGERCTPEAQKRLDRVIIEIISVH